VFLSGVVLEDGESLMDAGPPHHRQIFDELAAASQGNTVTVPFEVWCETFINDADPELAKTAYAQLAPEGYAKMLEPVDMKRFYTLDTPRSYILATEDIVFPSGEWGWHPRITSRLGPHRLRVLPPMSGQEGSMTMATRKRHTPEQVVRKLAHADRLLGEGRATRMPPHHRARG
jgi:hypothetical protein